MYFYTTSEIVASPGISMVWLSCTHSSEVLVIVFALKDLICLVMFYCLISAQVQYFTSMLTCKHFRVKFTQVQSGIASLIEVIGALRCYRGETVRQSLC